MFMINGLFIDNGKIPDSTKIKKQVLLNVNLQ
jgi:hypothetical protein